MSTRRRAISASLAFLACLGGWSAAAAAVIPPIEVPVSPPVTFSIFQNDGTGRLVDVSDVWLPEWTPATGGKPVFVVVNSAVPPTSVNLLSASAHPGQCTNVGLTSDLSPDVELSSGMLLTIGGVSVTGYQLTPLDCGASAVIQVVVDTVAYTVKLPVDGNNNGIADRWEAFFCVGVHACPIGSEDTDTGPVAGTAIGDGYTTFDEYRGFIVSGRQIRTDPRQKDLFVRVVGGECPTTATPASLLPTYFPDGGSVLHNTDTLISDTQIHLLGAGEWVDNFQSYSDATNVVYAANTDGVISDRRMNANARPVPPLLTPPPIQKGLRVIECLDNANTSPLGVAGRTTPNGPTNAIIYTRRIVDYLTGLMNAGGTRQLRYFAFVSGAWTLQATGAHNDPAMRNLIITRALAYYIAHEKGHSVQLTPTIEGTNKTTYGYHHAPETGSNLDQALVNKVDSKASGFNSFYIPLSFNSNDQVNARFK